MIEKPQIVHIHGGMAFSKYEDFLTHLRSREIEDPLGLQEKRRWREWLKHELGETAEFYALGMPNSQNAKYTEWSIWFERHFPLWRDGVVLIGHSLGGYFLAKYLGEHTVPFKVAAVFLVAAPFRGDTFTVDGATEDGGDFSFDPQNLPNLAAQADQIFIYHSKDDPIVPFQHAEWFHEAFPTAELCTFEDKGHFIDPEFPEIATKIKDILSIDR